jgi:hypothetical protein
MAYRKPKKGAAMTAQDDPQWLKAHRDRAYRAAAHDK